MSHENRESISTENDKHQKNKIEVENIEKVDQMNQIFTPYRCSNRCQKMLQLKSLYASIDWEWFYQDNFEIN